MADFRKGDRVFHRSMGEYGTVDKVEGETVFVTYDRTSPSTKPRQGHKARSEQHWVGQYDRNWFLTHPDMLVRTDRAPLHALGE